MKDGRFMLFVLVTIDCPKWCNDRGGSNVRTCSSVFRHMTTVTQAILLIAMSICVVKFTTLQCFDVTIVLILRLNIDYIHYP